MGVPIAGLSPVNYWAQLGGLVFNAIDQLGIKWFFNDPVGWMDGTTISVAQQQRGAQHGAWVGTSWLEPRSIVFAGMVTAPSPILAWQARNVLLGVVASLSALGVMNVDTILAINEPDALKTAAVRPSDKPTVTPVDGNVFQFSIPLTARDPRKYGVGKTATITLPVAASGLTFPVGPFSVTFGGTGNSGSAALGNLGNFPSEPVYTVNGPCVNPSIIQVSTGATLALNITLGSSDSLTVNADLSSVILNGQASRGNTVLPGSTFPYLPPGQSSVQFSASSYSSAATLVVNWSDTWW
jgi:hypothetical protein